MRMACYGDWTLVKLKTELSRIGAKTSGRKAELINRLEAYERNGNFNGEPFMIHPQTPMPLWPSNAQFRSVTNEHFKLLPTIHCQQIDQYVLYRQTADTMENKVTNFKMI